LRGQCGMRAVILEAAYRIMTIWPLHKNIYRRKTIEGYCVVVKTLTPAGVAQELWKNVFLSMKKKEVTQVLS